MMAALVKHPAGQGLRHYLPQSIVLAVLAHIVLVWIWQLEFRSQAGGGGRVLGHMSVSLGGSGAEGPQSDVPDHASAAAPPPVLPAAEDVASEPVIERAPPQLPALVAPRRRAIVTPPVRRDVRPAPRQQERRPSEQVPTRPQRQSETLSGHEGDGRPVGNASAGAPTRGAGTPSPSAGDGSAAAGRADQELAYLEIVRNRIAQKRMYPSAARRNRLEGTTSVRIEIGANGQVVSASVVQASGHFQLDRAARRMIDKAAPFPLPPFAPFRATIPIEFELR